MGSHLKRLMNTLSMKVITKVKVIDDHVDLCLLLPKDLIREFIQHFCLSFDADSSQHPPYQYAQESGPSILPPIPRFPASSGEWTSQRPTRPSVEVNPRPRLSMSIPNPAPPVGAWFTIDETPQRNQAGWSQAQVEIYNAGWGDALRAVEAGSIGVGGQQCKLKVTFDQKSD
jgi:hypothetical protein